MWMWEKIKPRRVGSDEAGVGRGVCRVRVCLAKACAGLDAVRIMASNTGDWRQRSDGDMRETPNQKGLLSFQADLSCFQPRAG